ncbi:MAG: AAC(3) family N-acetyltransferase [Pseudomonadota bacterium]
MAAAVSDGGHLAAATQRAGPFGVADLLEDLRALGIAAGDGLFVHASLGRVGPVMGGARTVIEALIAAVGPAGLISMPAFSTDAYPPEKQLAGVQERIGAARLATLRDQVQGFDRDRSPAVEMGVIAETFRTWPGVLRSDHPSTSVTALGEDACAITARQPLDFACGPDGPFGRMAERAQMKVLLLGVDWTRCTALHTAETMARHRRYKWRHVLANDGQGRRWVDARDVAHDLGRLFPGAGAALERAGAVATGKIGRAEARLVALTDILRIATPWIEAKNAAQTLLGQD